MRKISLTAALVAAVATLAIIGGVTAASANNGAVVINDRGCAFLDGNGGEVFVDASHAVVTHSGNSLLICKASGVPNDTGKAVHWNPDNTGGSCTTLNGLTNKWQETVSASGEATIACHFKP